MFRIVYMEISPIMCKYVTEKHVNISAYMPKYCLLKDSLGTVLGGNRTKVRELEDGLN